jgi:predicted nucleic-acid-binding protein
MEIEEKYNPVGQTYIKQRLLIQMKYFNKHSYKLLKKRRAKA